jgi:hypothetical protein
MTQDVEQWRNLADAVMNIQVSKRVRKGGRGEGSLNP